MKKYWDRRDFLKQSAAAVATLGMGLPMSSLLTGCKSNNGLPATADSVILLFMAGGMAHTETFDPKKYTPFTKGMQADSNLSTFKSVPTTLDGIHFSEGLLNSSSPLVLLKS